MARIWPARLAVFADCAVDGGVRFTSQLYRLWLTASRSALPLRPIIQKPHLLGEAGLLDDGVHVRASEAFADRLSAVGHAPDGKCGDDGVQLEFALINFVE